MWDICFSFLCVLFFLIQSENHSGQEIGFLRHLFSIHQSKFLDHLLYCRYQAWLQGDPDVLPAMSGGGLLVDPESQHVASAGVWTEISECQAEAGIQGMEDFTSKSTSEGAGDTGGSRQAGEQWETQSGWSMRCRAAWGWSAHLPFGVQSSCWHGNRCKINSRWYFRRSLGDCPESFKLLVCYV